MVLSCRPSRDRGGLRLLLQGPLALPALALGRDAQLRLVARAALGLAAGDALLRRRRPRSCLHGRPLPNSRAATGRPRLTISVELTIPNGRILSQSFSSA